MLQENGGRRSPIFSIPASGVINSPRAARVQTLADLAGHGGEEGRPLVRRTGPNVHLLRQGVAQGRPVARAVEQQEQATTDLVRDRDGGVQQGDGLVPG